MLVAGLNLGINLADKPAVRLCDLSN